MTYQHLLVEQRDGVVTVRLNRPEDRNKLNSLLMAELTDFALRYRARTDVHAIILTGGSEFFSAGADLNDSILAARTEKPTLLELRALVQAGPDLCKAWEEIEPVTIVAIEGYCVGGACALSLCFDFRVLGAGAMMRLPEVPLGINMSWRSLPRLTTLVGPARAKRFAMFGEMMDATTLMDWGMADEVTVAGAAEAAAQRWAAKVAELPPLPVRMTKEAINATANANHYATSFMDRDQFLLSFDTDDLREGIQSFLEKRKPKFTGN